MLNNQLRRQLLERHKQSGFPGSIIDVYKAYEQGIDIISNFEQQQMQQQMQVAQTPQQQQEGLRPFHQAGNTNQSMVFPNVPANQPFNTVGMKAPINIKKFDNQGHLVKSYENVPPGIENLPTGPNEGTVIETPANMQSGGFKPAPRIGARENPDGTQSTHLYATETLDGKNWVSFPTLFQNPDSSWVDMSKGDWYPAYEEALKRGEVLDFGRRKNKALKWGEGSWKDSMQSGGQLAPIYTANPKDPKLQAYNDSLHLYNSHFPSSAFATVLNEIRTDPNFRYYRPSTSQELNAFPGKIKPIGGTQFDTQRLIADSIANPNMTYATYTVFDKNGRAIPNAVGVPMSFKEPVQPVIYRELSELTPKQPPKSQLDFNKSLQQFNRKPVTTRPPQTIYKQDPSVSTGQYPIGERIWDPTTKTWKTSMWDVEMQKDSRELAIPRQERWRTIEVPEGGFQSGGQLPPIYTDNLKDPALIAYNDSLNLHNAMLMQDLLMGPNPKSAPSYNMTWTPQQLREYRTPQWNSQLQMNISLDWENEREMMESLAGDPSAKANQKLIEYYKSLGFTDADIMYHTSPDVVHPTIRAIGTYHDGEAYSPIYKEPVQPVIYRELAPLTPRTALSNTYADKSILQSNVELPKPSKRAPQPIMRADFSRGIARQGQYQIGERYWDDDKKRWKEDRWSPEEIKESKRIAIEGLKPPGEYIGKFEFGYGGKRKYQSGGGNEQLYPQSTINLPPAEIVANAPEAPSEKIPWYSTINFRKWGLRDYGDDVNFGKAFRDAFNRGEEQFVWRGDRFSTKMKETVPEPAVPKQKQPTKPFKNEYDPFSPMGVASFLGNKYDGTPEAALALADTIGYHESDKGMDPKQKQHNNGPARGLYQIEPESMGTYIQRAKNYAADNKLKVPDWIMNAPEDASELTRDQQTVLFLINMAMHPNTNMRKYFSGDMSTEDMWMAGWKEKPAAGGTDRNAFKTSIKSAQQLGIPNAYSTQPPPPKIQPPPAKEDELPSGVITPPPGLKAGGFKYPRYPKKVSYNNKRMN